nr:DNA-processing protein DprA [Metabacillus mangrovi]
MTPSSIRKIFHSHSSYDLISKRTPAIFLETVPESSRQAFLYDFRNLKPAHLRKELLASGISFLTIHDTSYPDLLKQIPDPPLFLFCIGDTGLLNEKLLFGVAGARKASPYGLKALEKVLPPLIRMKMVIVSGLAEGIDTAAHAAAISHGGRTIAVLGGGFRHIYPASNRQLAKAISKDHLLLSEYAPHVRPQKWHFPERNRIISGLSMGVLVAEAKQRSGSLITAQAAMEQGRDVFAIPGSILSGLSEGTHALINDGARLVTCAEDILEELLGLQWV